MSESKPRCAKKWWKGFAYVQCSNPVREGSQWCGTHSPQALRRRKQAAEARYQEQVKNLRDQRENDPVRKLQKENERLQAEVRRLRDELESRDRR